MRKAKGIIAVGSLLTLVFSILLSGKIALAEQSFPLTCRGGGDLKFFFNQDRDDIVIQFKKGVTGVGTGGTLSPGECSWIDRGFRPDEPFHILHKGVRGFGISWIGNQVKEITSTNAPYLKDLRDSNKTFIFQVYRDFYAPWAYMVLVIKRFGP